jgi:hypothetical protein
MRRKTKRARGKERLRSSSKAAREEKIPTSLGKRIGQRFLSILFVNKNERREVKKGKKRRFFFENLSVSQRML